uniref:Uncharacterized protein n=1 Tax=Arundo donax TaxID=35708 RepID=A0A0A9DIC6_ARUDO
MLCRHKHVSYAVLQHLCKVHVLLLSHVSRNEF